MRRNERERLARRTLYQASRSVGEKVGEWIPKAFSLEDYFAAIKSHGPIPELLEFLSQNHREWSDDDFEYHRSDYGACEKCNTRALKLGPMAELKSSGDSGFDRKEIQYSKFIAEQFVAGKEAVVLTPNLHREFICQSWIEGVHLDHIKDHAREPGIAAIEAQPELTDGMLSLNLSFRAVDGSHRAALTYREGQPFSAYILTPVESLQSVFAIGSKKNPFFAVPYSPEGEAVLAMMARETTDANVKS